MKSSLFALALLAAAPLIVLAQTPGATVPIPAGEQPLPGPGQGPLLERDARTTWSRHPSGTAGLSRGWKQILLADINGDGRDDLCGSYGLANGQRAYGCVLNGGATTFGGNLLQAAAFNGAVDASIHSTIALVDLDGNGSRHLCGRVMEGVKCQRFNGTGFDAPALVHTAFSDANSWNQEPYFATIGFARLNRKLALCGRGVAGVMCFEKSGSGFSTSATWATTFSDSNGWNHPHYFRTLRYVDIDHDGHSDICARGTEGILCSTYRYTFRTFDAPRWITNQFADRYGWHDARYFPSVRFGDLNGDGITDVCGRGTAGLYCGMNNSGPGIFGSIVGAGNLSQAEMSDASNWGNPPANLDSLQIVDFDGDSRNDVCGLNALNAGGPTEFFCARSTSTPVGARFESVVRRIQSIVPVGKVLAGRIYARPGATGFCWGQQDGSVGCSVEFR